MKKLHKVEQGKMLCGVCTGIAAYFDIDPTLVRLGWVLFSLLGGKIGVRDYSFFFDNRYWPTSSARW